MQTKFMLVMMLCFFVNIPLTFATASFEELPQDLKLLIFSKLKPLTLLECAKVNRKWRDAASGDIVWKPLMIKVLHLPDNGRLESFSLSKTALLLMKCEFYLINYDNFQGLRLNNYPKYKYFFLLHRLVYREEAKALYEYKKKNAHK